MTKFLPVLIVAILAGSAGFGGGWWYFTRSVPGPADAGAEDPRATPVFVNIGPFTIPVLGGDRIDQFVTLVVAVEVGDASTADHVRTISPRLTDAYITALYGAIAGGGVLRSGIVDVSQVKEELVKASGHVLGENAARDVLVQVVSQRPM